MTRQEQQKILDKCICRELIDAGFFDAELEYDARSEIIPAVDDDPHLELSSFYVVTAQSGSIGYDTLSSTRGYLITTRAVRKIYTEPVPKIVAGITKYGVVVMTRKECKRHKLLKYQYCYLVGGYDDLTDEEKRYKAEIDEHRAEAVSTK